MCANSSLQGSNFNLAVCRDKRRPDQRQDILETGQGDSIPEIRSDSLDQHFLRFGHECLLALDLTLSPINRGCWRSRARRIDVKYPSNIFAAMRAFTRAASRCINAAESIGCGSCFKRMFKQCCCKAHPVLAKVRADRAFRGSAMVTLVEKQVERTLNGWKTRGELRIGRDVK